MSLCYKPKEIFHGAYYECSSYIKALSQYRQEGHSK
jgi:hypothetical protein